MKLFYKINFQKSWIVCCLFNFTIASVMGLLMRFSYLFPLKNVNYAYLLHAHSHVAMLGWAYLMIYVLIVHFFIPKDKSQKPIYNRLFWITQCSIIGMMISFTIQGYALFSILFSTMHIILSYVFCGLIWRDCIKGNIKKNKFLLAAILFMVFSTFGIWCLGPALNLLGKQSGFYQIAIQFFLHFQFNGWFLFAVLALFVKQFTSKIDETKFKIFFAFLVFATFLTLAFPVSRYITNSFLNYINTIGVICQLIAFIYGYKMLQPQINQFKTILNSMSKMAYNLALYSLFFKIGIQLLVFMPCIDTNLFHIRNLVIGFIHLTTLGIITGFLLGILIQNKLFPEQSFIFRIGIKYFFLGYIATEIILFLQGVLLYFNKGLIFGYNEIVFGASAFLVTGLVLVLTSVLKSKSKD